MTWYEVLMKRDGKNWTRVDNPERNDGRFEASNPDEAMLLASQEEARKFAEQGLELKVPFYPALFVAVPQHRFTMGVVSTSGEFTRQYRPFAV